MAWICPLCSSADAVPYIKSPPDGLYPLPCLDCKRSVAVGHAPLAELVGCAPCSTDGCTGVVSDRFQYGAQAQLIGVVEGRCSVCGQRKPRKVKRAATRGGRRHAIPDPRTRMPS
ncbi:hypothetical protein SAMN05216268_104113 [Streptomyces yunnanensis]|uniref:Uncharacterized protein n=1 Tax=Streptomyces yunnanensis TaxID=156453 RepID=A0A9X8QQL7_9ACTN|nr:hypothetical protein SAMN05216268_104113 [Streptomyces yunnanensis]